MPRGAGSGKRRQRKRPTSTKRRLLRAAIIARDNGHCWICGRAVDLTATPPTGLAATLDHVLPHAEGGTYDPSNLRLACYACNIERGRS